MKANHSKKAGKLSLLDKWTVKFRDWAVPMVPSWMETYHLTLMTILWSLGIVFCGWAAYFWSNLNWFWLSSFFIAMQWVTDVLDGELGRQRNTGLIKWGFFMDHFLDYIFLCAVLISYVFTLPGEYWQYSLFTFMIFGAFMVNSFLYFGALGRFKIQYHGLGPTETRVAFILLNTIAILFHPAKIAFLLPWLLAAALIVLIYVVYKDQKEIWAVDMKEKKKK